MILVALLVTGRAIPVRGGLVRQPLGGRRGRARLTLPTVVGTVVGVVALLVTAGTWRSAVIGTFIAAIIALSLVVVTGYAGQVSLAQLALAGARRSRSAASPRAGASRSRSRRCWPRSWPRWSAWWSGCPRCGCGA